MEIKFNVHGRQRKELVTKLADYTHQKAEYEYTPTYAYQIGKYTVNKDGVLTSPSEIPANLLDNLRHLIWAKGQLIKDACQLETLPLNVDKEQVSFNWCQPLPTKVGSL